jgi:sugar phosphate isomerase/epimerase
MVNPGEVGTLADTAVETLELMPHLFNGPNGPALREALQRLFGAGRVRPASVHAIFGGARDISVHEESARAVAVQHTVGAVQMAGEFRAPLLVVHASAEPIAPAERAARIAQCRRSLAEIGRAAQPYGVRITIELLPRTCLGNTAAELEQIVEGLDSAVFGFCLDTNHGMTRWKELPDDVRRLGPRLWALHVSDYDGVDEKHWLPGQGVIDWPAFVRALCEVGYRGPFNYEARLAGNGFAERVQSLEANFRWICAHCGIAR